MRTAARLLLLGLAAAVLSVVAVCLGPTHLLDLPMERGLTWDPEVLEAVVYAVANPGQIA